MSNAEQRELGGLPDAIERAEARVAVLSQTLADPSSYTSGGREILKLSAELELAKTEVEKFTLRWEELELKRAE